MKKLSITSGSLAMLFCSLFLLQFCNPACGQDGNKALPATIVFSNERNLPSGVPVVPLLSREKPYFDGGQSYNSGVNDYTPSGDGAFIRKNGNSEGRFSITTGAWRMLVGDKPIVIIEQRATGGAYARPGLMPYLGVKGKIRLKLHSGNTEKYLEDFSDITVKLAAGKPVWTCSDKDMNLQVVLTAIPFVKELGCAMMASISTGKDQNMLMEWHYENALHIADHERYAEFGWDKFTKIYTGSTSDESEVNNGVVTRSFKVNPSVTVSDTLVCSWGYEDYDRTETDSAFQRLRFRPFPSKEWTENMKKNWFEHWIGRGLEPELTFHKILKDPETAISGSEKFWEPLRSRVVIRTGNTRFDNTVQAIGSRLISDYEYPGYLHGSNYMKYGKINCGLYGHEAAGFHEEVANTLKFISGAQCVKGRQRYIMPNFRISQWAEEMNPYFIDQVWYHYRWTGDSAFLYDMWPSVRKAIEHYISTSDPEHDGIFTGFYESWNGDAKNRGGRCALSTALGISVLRNGYEMASIVRDVDWTFPGQQNPFPPADNDFRSRYRRLLGKAESAYPGFFNRKTGVYSSSEWEGELRNTPENEESSYAIWRGIGSPLENYSSMRYIRENNHETTGSSILEFCNRNWPVCWSNHYDSFSDAMASVAASAMANDIDNFWPMLRYLSEAVYTRPECTLFAGGGSQLSLESDQMFMMALLDNIFGIKPYFGKNLLVIRPSFPADWKNPGIAIPDVAYDLVKSENGIVLNVKTPLKRFLRAEIPVKGNIVAVTLNGSATEYSIKKEVNCCRVVVQSDIPLNENKIIITVGPAKTTVTGNTKCITGRESLFTVKGAEIKSLQCPQEEFAEFSYNNGLIHVKPFKTGKYTLFAELIDGKTSWYHPIELTVSRPWDIVEKYNAWEPGKKAELISPSLDYEKGLLFFQVENNTAKSMSGDILITIAGGTIRQKARIDAGSNASFSVPLSGVLDKLSPGTVPFKVSFENETRQGHAISWDIPVKGRLVYFDLRDHYNINIEKLYGNENYITWRIDYSGAGLGVDWRDDLKIDAYGYQNMVQPISHVNWGVLPEHHNVFTRWILPELPSKSQIPVSFPFTGKNIDSNNILALIDAQNSRSLPSTATISLEKPETANKIYLLTANLTKTCKSYYPAAEIEIFYESGDNQTVQLIPPYNMPSFVQGFCPEALHIPAGKLESTQTFGSYGEETGISLSDLAVDPSRKIRQIKLKCVSTETVFGIIGLTLLQ